MRRNKARTEGPVYRARTAHREAQDSVESLEARVASGDTSVTPRDLADARELVRFRELAITAARTEEAQNLAAGRQSAVDELLTEVKGTELPDIVAALRGVVDAVAALSSDVRARNDVIGTWTRRANELAAQGHTDPSLAVVGGTLHAGGIEYRAIPTAGLLTRILRTTGQNGIAPMPDQETRLDRVARELAAPVSPGVGLTIEQHEDFTRRAREATMAESVVQHEMTAFDQEAITAAELRHRRDVQVLPMDANAPTKQFPEWIDDEDLVAHVPDLVSLNIMRSNNQQGFGFTLHPTERRTVDATGRARVDGQARPHFSHGSTFPDQEEYAPGQVTGTGGDEPIIIGNA